MAAPKGNQFALGNNGGCPVKFNSPEELEIAIDNYFKDCNTNLKPYTMSGLAVALGVDRNTILNYSKKEEFFSTIHKARQKVEQYAEERLFGNSVAGVIFNLKNNFGWEDKREVTLQAKNNTDITPEQEAEILKQLPQ